jgi:hypothetical protein
MTKTLAVKVIEGLHSQGWQVSGYGGSWAAAMRPLEAYIQKRVERAVRAEREACAKVCEVTPPHPFRPSIEAAHAIRARSKA